MRDSDLLSHRAIVRDPVHGFIEVRAIEYILMQDPFLRRLHDIKQLGLNYLVFPGATHTRFSHSLGTMHVAGRIAERITPLARSGRLCGTFFMHCDRGVSEFVEVARLTGLLHDLGHPPLSHQFETSLSLIGRMMLFRQHEGGGILKRVYEAYKNISNENKNRDKKLHEALTKGFLRRLIRETEGSKLGVYVAAAAAVLGVEGQEWALEDLGINPASLPVLRDIISHEVFDADRLDYLMRDALMSGVVFGNIDIDRLLLALKVGLVNGRPRILVDSRGLQSLEDIYDARYKMFKSVYFHHKSRALNLALTRATYYMLIEWSEVVPNYILRAIESPEDLYIPDKLSDAIREKGVLYTDSDLFAIISRMSVSGSREARRWARSLLWDRRLLPISLIKRPDSFIMELASAVQCPKREREEDDNSKGEQLGEPGYAGKREAKPGKQSEDISRIMSKIMKIIKIIIKDEIRVNVLSTIKDKVNRLAGGGPVTIEFERVDIEMPSQQALYEAYKSLYMATLSNLGSVKLLYVFAFSDDEETHIKLYRNRDNLRKMFIDAFKSVVNEAVIKGSVC